MAGKGGRPGPRFRNFEREEVIDRVATLNRRGYSQAEIAEIVGVSQPTVHEYLKKVKERYLALQMSEAHVYRLQKLDEYRDIVAEAWDAWQRSQEDAEKVVEEIEPLKKCPRCNGTKKGPKGGECKPCKGTGSVGGVLRTTKTREGQVGDARFLQILKGVHDSMADLLGLPLGDKGGNQVVVLDWDAIVNRRRSKGQDTDDVEARIQEVEARAIADKPSDTPKGSASKNGTNGQSKPR